MKLFVFLSLLAGLTASASEFLPIRSCTTQEWGLISTGLSAPAISGEEFRGEVQSMIAEEMGPQCIMVPEKDPQHGIPGNRYYTFLLKSGQRTYKLNVIVGGVEQPGTTVAITKLK